MAQVIEVNIKERAYEVFALFNANRPADAVALLERHRQGQPESCKKAWIAMSAPRHSAASPPVQNARRCQVTPLVGQLVGSMGRRSDAHSERMSASLAIWPRSKGLRGSITCY